MAGTSAKAPPAPRNDDLELLTELRRPFTPAAVKFKIQTVKNGKAMVVCYIDARLTAARLNKVVGLEWEDRYEEIDGGLRCYLTVRGFTRTDVGEPGDSPQGRKPKALYSDAFKRAGVKFGIGESLYAVPQMWLEGDDLRNEKFISKTGAAKLRAGYSKWLELTGIQSFGDPLDHGDVDDAAGDHEVQDRDMPEQRVERVTQVLTARPNGSEATGAARPPAVQATPPSGPQQGMREIAADAAAAMAATADPANLTPAQMAALAFVDWIPRASSEEAKAERNAIAAGIAMLTGNVLEDGSPNIKALPGTWSGRGNLLYGLLGERIQSRDECAAAIAEALQAGAQA